MALLDSAYKQRMVGALVLVALAVIFLPMLFSRQDEQRQVVVEAPAAPQAPAVPQVQVEPVVVPEPQALPEEEPVPSEEDLATQQAPSMPVQPSVPVVKPVPAPAPATAAAKPAAPRRHPSRWRHSPPPRASRTWGRAVSMPMVCRSAGQSRWPAWAIATVPTPCRKSCGLKGTTPISAVLTARIGYLSGR